MGNKSCAMVLDFSLVAPGGATSHASGFLHALACMDEPPSGLLVCLPADRSLLVEEERRLDLASIPTQRIGSVAAAGSWRSRIVGQFALPLLVIRRRPRVVLIPRDIAPILVSGRVVLVATNVLRWRGRADLEERLGRPSVRVRTIEGLKNWAAGIVARRAAAVIAPSQVVADLLPERRHLVVIPFGIDLEVAQVRSEPLNERRPLRIVVLSNITRHKRLDLVVELVAELVRVHGVEATLDVWGGLHHEDVVSSLKEQMSVLLGDSGRLRGPIDPSDRRAMLVEADVLAVGSGVESFGFPLIEAQATGTLVVAPDSPLVVEQCGGRAVRYPEGDAAAGAALLADLLDPDRSADVRAKLDAGLFHAAGYTWKRCVEETLDLLAEVTRA